MRVSKKQKMEEIREWRDDDEEVEVINLISESDSSEEEEDYSEEEQQRNAGVREEEEKADCCEDSAREASPRMDPNLRKWKPKEDPDDEDHDVKWRKDFETWKDLEELMKARVVRGNCRRGDEGPLDLFADVLCPRRVVRRRLVLGQRETQFPKEKIT